MEFIISLLVAVIGLLVYVLASNPKVAELGRVSYFVGLAAFLFKFGNEVVQLFK